MPDAVLLVDFGASRVKSVHWSLAQGCAVATRECAAPTLQHGARGEAEGTPEAYWRTLEETAGALLESSPDVGDLWLCSEMHGFMLADRATSRPLTPYISWQDQRASHREHRMPSTLEGLETIRPTLMAEAGMRLRPGLPIANLADLQAHGAVPAGTRFLTLADWLLLRGGETAPLCHPTLAAGTGLYSLADQAWSPELMAQAGIESAALQMPAIQSRNGPIGTIRLKGRALRVWGGLGDLQAAAYGVGFPRLASILVNLGTGSQVLAITPDRAGDIELRPCALGELSHAVTHIPSGRALNSFAAFVDGCARLGGGQPIFWKTFSELTTAEVLAAEPCVDLNVFEAAWRFNGGGGITRITENTFHVRWLTCAIAKSWLLQYAQVLATILPALPSSLFLLGGGLSRRAPFVQPVLESLLDRKCVGNPLRTGEETLDGLLKLAETSH